MAGCLIKRLRKAWFLLGLPLIAYHCAAQLPVVAEQTAIAYVTTTAQLKSDYLPDNVFELRKLRTLIVKGSDCDYIQHDENGRVIKNCWMLRALPPAIKNLSSLEELRLPLNTLTTLPAELAALRQLRLLDLTDNAGLTDIDAITNLPQLQELYLYGCYLEKLPANVGKLKKLRILGLGGNMLSSAEQVRIRRALPGCTIYF